MSQEEVHGIGTSSHWGPLAPKQASLNYLRSELGMFTEFLTDDDKIDDIRNLVILRMKRGVV